MSGLTEHATDALKGFGISAGRSVRPLEDLDKELVDKQDDMHAVDRAVERLAHSIGVDLPKNAHRGTEKFRRSATQIAGMERLISHGFDLMREGIYKLNQILQVNRLQAFLEAVNLHKLTEIGHGLAHIGTAGGQLTTSYEAAAQAASVSTRKVVASSGVWGKALDKLNAQAAGMVIGMKLSEQTAGHAAVASHTFAKELAAVGITSATTGAKLEDALGIPILELGQNLGQMRKDLNLTDKDLDEVTRQFTATGEAIHDMQIPFQQLPHFLELARNRANLLAEGLSDIGGKDVLKSVNAAIRGIYAITGDAKGAVDSATALEQTLSGAMNQFGKLFAGTSTDLDKFLINTSVVTGDVRQAFSMARKGPIEFLTSFSTVVAKLKKSGKSIGEILNFFEQQMEEGGLAPEAAKTITGLLRNMDVDKLALLDTTKVVGKSMGKMANEAWRSSMTLQESFDLMMGSAESRFRRIGQAATMTFVHQTGKAFDTFNEKASALVKEGGPMGMLVKKMAEISFIGAKALLPQALQPIAMLFGHLSPMVFEAVTAFTQLGPILMHLVNPFTLLVGLVAAFHLGIKQAEVHLASQNKTYQQNAKAITAVETNLKNLKKGTAAYTKELDKLKKLEASQGSIEAGYRKEATANFVKDLNKRIKAVVDYAKALVSHIPEILHEVGDAFKSLAAPPPEGIDWKEIWKAVVETATKAFHGIQDFWKNLIEGLTAKDDPKSAEPLGKQLGRLLRTAFNFAYDEIRKYLADWWKRMGDIWGDTNKPFGDKVKETAEGSAGILIAAFAIGKFTPVFDVLGLLGSALGGLLRPALTAGLGLLWDGIVGIGATLAGWGETIAIVIEFFTGLTVGITAAIAVVLALVAAFAIWPEKANAAVDTVVKWVKGGFSKLAEWVTTLFVDLFTGLLDVVMPDKGESWVEHFEKLFMRIVDAIRDVFAIVPKLIIGIFSGVWDGIENALLKKFPEAGEKIKQFFDYVRRDLGWVGDALKELLNPIKAIEDGLSWVGKKLGLVSKDAPKEMAKDAAEGVKAAVAKVSDEVKPGVEKTMAAVTTEVKAGTKDIALQVSDSVQKGMNQAVDSVAQSTDDITKQVGKADIFGPLNKIGGVGTRVGEKLGKEIAQPVAAATNESVKAAVAAVPEQVKPAVAAAMKDVSDQIQVYTKALAASLPAQLQPGIDQAIGAMQGGGRAMAGALASGLQEGMDLAIKVVQDGAQLMSNTLAGSIQEGMNKAVDSVQQSTDAIATQVEKVFYDKITVSITDSFTETFRIVLQQTKRFMDVMGKGFADFANAVNHLFREMWLRSLADTDISVQAMKNSIASSIRDMKTLQEAMDNIRNTRAEMLKDAANAGELGEAIKPKPGQKMDEALLDQTGDPDWYRKDYRDLFKSEMAKLAGAIRSMPVQSGSTSAGQAYQRLAGKGKGAVEPPLAAPGGSFPNSFGTNPR